MPVRRRWRLRLSFCMKMSRIKKIGLGIVVMAISIEVIVVWPNTSEALAAPCVLGSCPKEVRIISDGQRLTYRVGRRFSVILNRFDYPLEKLSCKGADGDIVQEIVSLRDHYPYDLKRFELMNSGECVMRNGDFTATIVAVE